MDSKGMPSCSPLRTHSNSSRLTWATCLIPTWSTEEGRGGGRGERRREEGRGGGRERRREGEEEGGKAEEWEEGGRVRELEDGGKYQLVGEMKGRWE